MKLNLRSRRMSLWPFSAIRKVGSLSPYPSPSPRPSPPGEAERLDAALYKASTSFTSLNFSPSPGGEGRGEGGLPRSPSTCQAFTMIEIAISLAIIGFALVAIIGILPTAMNAQRDNRQETIINQDASILVDAVRNGERGLDDLTNYVVGITNYLANFNRSGVYQNTAVYAYTVPMGYVNNSPNPRLALTNGYTIVGVLSTPKIIPNASGVGFVSNHVVAVFRSMSGPASEKPPQLNTSMQELALDYRVILDNSGYGTNYFDPSWTNYAGLALTNDIAIRSNYMAVVKSFQTNLHDVRLTFLWPVLPSGKIGSGRQVYRTMVAGHYTNDPPGSPYFFYQPRTFY